MNSLYYEYVNVKNKAMSLASNSIQLQYQNQPSANDKWEVDNNMIENARRRLSNNNMFNNTGKAVKATEGSTRNLELKQNE